MEVASPLPNGTQLSNHAELSSDQGASASADETTTVQSSLVLGLGKSDSPDPVQPGEVLTYELTYGNDSSAGAVATNVVLRETYDANVVYLTANPPPDNGDNEWLLEDLSPGDSGTITVQVQVETPLADGTLLTNIAVIEADQGSASAEESTVVDSMANLRVEVSDSPDPVRRDAELTYDIIYGNDATATSTATGTVLRLTYDPDLTFISADVPPVLGTDNEWTLGDLSPGEGGALSVRTRVNGGSQLTTRIEIESDQGSSSAEATTRVSRCAAQAAASGQLDSAESLELSYAIRDEVLPTLNEGQWLRDTYYRHADEVGLRLLLDRRLRGEAQTLLRQVRPRLKAAIAGEGLRLGATDTLAIKRFAAKLQSGASTQLKADLDHFVNGLEGAGYIGGRR
jgi:hypothetical protein